MNTFQSTIAWLRRGWLIVLIGTLAGIAGGLTLTIAQRPLYQATSRVYVSIQSAGSVTDLSQGSAFTQQAVKSYADIASTPFVLDGVIRQLRLRTSATDLAKQIEASSELDEVVIDIKVSNHSAALAAAISNTTAQRLSAAAEELTPDTTNATSGVKLTIVQAASTPQTPVSPLIAVNLLLGALGGVALGTACAFGRDALDTRVRRATDLETAFDTPQLGAVPTFAPQTPTPLPDTPNSSLSPIAESYKTLRTNLQFIPRPNRTNCRVYVVTSSTPGEGKSTTAANLASTMARSGQRTLLIDADMRRPMIANYLGIEGGIGLSDILVSATDIAHATQTWGDSGLEVIPAGHKTPNPSELLGSSDMASLINALRTDYDVLILDSPPVLPVADATILATMADDVLVVCRIGKTHKAELRESLHRLRQLNARVAGLVATHVRTRGPDAYTYAGYAPYVARDGE